MKKLSAINFNRNVKNGTIIALALAVVIGMSYFGSQDYLNQSIMDMLIGATQGVDECGPNAYCGSETCDFNACGSSCYDEETESFKTSGSCQDNNSSCGPDHNCPPQDEAPPCSYGWCEGVSTSPTCYDGCAP